MRLNIVSVWANIIIFVRLFNILKTTNSLSSSNSMSKTVSQNDSNTINSSIRIELFFQSSDDLRQRVKFLSSEGFTSYNIVNKNNRDTLLQWVDTIREEVPTSHICVHYSAKYNKSRQKDGAFHNFEQFMKDMDARQEDCESDRSNNEVLLISGSGDKPKFNSLTGLQRLSTKITKTSIAVAFNPFMPNSQDFEVEKKRLQAKLATHKVSKIYFQFGTDLQRLRTALDWLTTEVRNDEIGFEICGSIFLPTKKLINQQKFRPWNGVYLNQEFLESEEGARGIVLEMIKLYKSYNCELIIEAPGVRNEKDIAIVKSLLRAKQLLEENTTTSKQPTKEERHRQQDGGIHGTSTAATTAARSEEETNEKRRKIERLSPSPLVAPAALQKPAIVLFGSHDVRIHDNEAFQLASFHESVIPVFLWCPNDQGKWGVIGAAEVVLKDALKSLDSTLTANGLKLICRSTDSFQHELSQLCMECDAITIYWNKEHTTESRIREQQCKATLESIGVQAIECQSSLLYDPTVLDLKGGFNGGHWGTLMPFLKACQKQLGPPRRPILRHETFALLQSVQGPKSWPDLTRVDNLDNFAQITGRDRWDEPILARFPMNEEEGLKTMNEFMKNGFERYEKERSRADINTATSRLSVHLRIGTVSPNEFYYKIEDSGLDYSDRRTISRRLFWRDLAYYQLLNFPKMREISIRTHYDKTEWATGEEETKRFEAWKKGQTGYPLVDAGMRELWATGWMTQSVRMVVASFLTEYLRVNWVKGCEWFHYTLADADSAINSMMWQNAGRAGIDQWNFVMSPVAASQDMNGDYTRRWVPELSKLSKPVLHRPWEASPDFLEQMGVILGDTYPHRIVSDLVEERQKTVANVLKMRKNNQEFNSNRGYDVIELPDGSKTVVFTKKEFRIDSNGGIVPVEKSHRSKKSREAKSKALRGRKARQNSSLK